MILNQWVCPFTDGHYPKVCPGRQPLVAFGSAVVRVVNWQTGELLLEAKGRAPHWLTDTVVTWIEELGADRDRRWEFDITTRTSRATDDDPALVAANEFSAANGSWGSYLAVGRRLVVNGRVVPGAGTFRGISIGGSEFLTAINDSFLQFFDLTTFAPTRSVQPAGTWNQWRNCNGLAFHGYFGDTFVASLTQATSVSHTITPWHAEGVAVSTVASGGRVWTATATEIAPSTKETRVGVLVRPFGDTRCLAVWDVEMNTFDMGYMPGRLIVAGASTKGVLVVLELDEKAAVKPLAWPTSPDRPFTQAVAWGGYHRYTGRPDWPMLTSLPFENCAIVTDSNGAIAAAGSSNILVTDLNLKDVTLPEKVVGFYEGSEGSVERINAYCRNVRTLWTEKFPGRLIPPVVCYMQPAQAQAWGGAYPNEVDIFSPQFYFELGEMPPRIDFFATMNSWLKVLPNDRLWMPTVQTYDRNFQWNAAQMTVLANQMGQLISLSRAYEYIIGFACFAVNRPGGIVNWPELREALSRVGTVGRIGTFPSRWPYRPAVVTPEPEPEPEPEPNPGDDMNAADIRRYVAELPDKALFGALERFHNEVLPRDRPKDGIIKNADDTDMWTGDVVTGGANGYLMRAMISEYIIARDAGRSAEQALGDGYDAAKKSYDKAVGNPQ